MTRAVAGYLRRVLSDELFVLWSAARAEANMAYDAVYRAAEDRADAAEVALSASATPALAVA